MSINGLTLTEEHLLVKLTDSSERLRWREVEASVVSRQPDKSSMEVLLHEASAVSNGTIGPEPVANCCARPNPEVPGEGEALRNGEKNGTAFSKTKNDESMDLMFENISYTVSLGMRKGKL
jgi:hypothetical protein